MIPGCLLEHIWPIGNAAGTGDEMCAVSRETFLRGQMLAVETQVLDLASMLEFQDCFVTALDFSENAE